MEPGADGESCVRSLKTVLELLNVSSSVGMLSTGSKKLDECLGGGIQIGQVTELVGEAGTGKTQLCLQLVTKTVCNGYSAVILDTEGKIMMDRLTDMLTAELEEKNRSTVEPVIKRFKASSSTSCSTAGRTVESCLNSVLYRHCSTPSSLSSAVNLLNSLLSSKSDVKLIVIDSIAHPFRFSEDKEEGLRKTGILAGIVQTLNKHAAEFQLAVVLTNQVAANINKTKEFGAGDLKPCLGPIWLSLPSVRLWLRHDLSNEIEDRWAGLRTANLEKSPSRKNSEVRFVITKVGIRDPEPD